MWVMWFNGVNELLRVSCVIVALSATLWFSAFVVSFVPGLVSDLGGAGIGSIKGRIHEMHLMQLLDKAAHPARRFPVITFFTSQRAL